MGVPELSNCPYGNRQCLLLFISISMVYALVMKHYLTLRLKNKKDWKETPNRSLRFFRMKNVLISSFLKNSFVCQG